MFRISRFEAVKAILIGAVFPPLVWFVARLTVLNTVTLTVQSEDKGQMNILVTDIQGREVYSTTWTVENGTNSMSVDMRSLNAGLYFVKATLNGNASYYKIYKK